MERMLIAARDEVDSVDTVILPESAIDESDIEDLGALLSRYGVLYLQTGVRQPTPQPGRLAGNWMHFGVNPRLEKGGPLPSAGQQWFHMRQDKHHRWSLDAPQIYQYHLGGALHPHIRWWEATDVPRRAIQFVEAHEVTIVSLVCEDLAQSDDVAQVIRAVGPTILVTPLFDGPQLTSRWSARYAGVFAYDPGSAVCTLAPHGMVERCRPYGRDPSSVVALWKAPGQGAREIRLEPGAQGVLLTVCADRATRRSADGRWPVDNAIDYFDVAVYQVRASATGQGSPGPQSPPPAPRVLGADEVTILTGWAEAAAEALAYTPERTLEVLDDARCGAPWRAAVGMADPSPRVSEAIESIAGAVRASTPPAATPTFDAVHATAEHERTGEQGLGELARRVLLSTLEQLRARQAREADLPDT